MRKRTIIALIIATSLIVLGGMIFGGAMNMFKWDFNKLSTNKRETNEYTISESYQNISVVTRTADVVLMPSETAETKVVCKEQARLKHSVTVKDNTLVIELVDTQKWHDYFMNFAITKVTVYVPASQLDTVSVKNSTGKVSIQAIPTTEKVSISNSTGDVSLHNVLATGKISITNSTGNVKFKDCDAETIYVKNSTGDVTGNFLTEKQFITRVSTGDVKVPQSETGGRCEIITNTGDIRFTIG